MNKYYKCAVDSKVGQLIAKFHEKALYAVRKADDYAKRMGATAYIEPVQYFAGGVEYLEFDKEPNLEVWRKKTLGGCEMYEPNCQTFVGVDIVDSPENKWNKIYLKKPFSWNQVKNMHPLEYWAEMLGYDQTGDDEKDWTEVSCRMLDKKLFKYLGFSGSQKSKRGRTPISLRKAVSAEKQRISLPVAKVEELYCILPIHSDNNSNLLQSLRGKQTPIFFKSGSSYYIMLHYKTMCDELEEINEREFNDQKNAVMKSMF